MNQAHSFSGSRGHESRGPAQLGGGWKLGCTGALDPVSPTGTHQPLEWGKVMSGRVSGRDGRQSGPSQFAAGGCPASGWGEVSTLSQGWERVWLCITSWQPTSPGSFRVGDHLPGPVTSKPPAPGGPPLLTRRPCPCPGHWLCPPGASWPQHRRLLVGMATRMAFMPLPGAFAHSLHKCAWSVCSVVGTRCSGNEADGSPFRDQ